MSSPESPAPLSLDRIALMQTFVRIVEAGSLSAAAAQLGTTQPTISRRLQALERALGLPLLKRSTHTMKLTEDGERAYHRARALLDDWQALEADLRGAVDEPEGTLRVVVPHAFGQQQLVAPLADYLRRWPRVSVEWLLHDGTPDFVADGIDCAIQVGTTPDPSLVGVRLSQVPRIVVAAPSVLGGQAPPTHARELAALPWLALRTYYRDSITLAHEGTGEEATLALRPRMATDSLYALRSAALQGLGVAVGSAWVMAEDLAEGRLLQLVPQWRAEPLPVWLLYPPGRWQPARLRRFIEVMRGAMATAAWGGLQEGTWS